MSKLVIALLTDDDKLEKFQEIDMSWVDKFNSEFKNQSIPFEEKIYAEEFVDMASYAVLSNLVQTENDDEFQVNREPLKAILRKLFGYEQQQTPANPVS